MWTRGGVRETGIWNDLYGHPLAILYLLVLYGLHNMCISSVHAGVVAYMLLN